MFSAFCLTISCLEWYNCPQTTSLAIVFPIAAPVRIASVRTSSVITGLTNHDFVRRLPSRTTLSPHGKWLCQPKRKALLVAPRKPKPASHTGLADTTKAVDEFMSKLDHPFKAEIRAIRRSIMGANPTIAEGVKWNAPSFRTTDYFATTNLREPAGVGIILHLGARVRDSGPERVPISDPQNLLKWLAKDRAMVVFKDMADFLAKKSAFEEMVRQWITFV